MAVKGPGSERLGVGAAMRPPPTGSAVYGRSSSLPEQLGEFLAGGGAGFLQNVVHMGLHSAQGQLQRTGDVLVVLALQHLFQDDALARGQVTVLAEGEEQLVYVFLGVGRVGARRFLRTEAQGVDSGAQGEETSSISIRLGVRTS